MDNISIENVRCFQGRQSIPLKPVTLLVGENSTGKTTLLALVRALSDLCLRRSVNFNEDPFQLGAYDQIATFRGGRGGRANSFTIGTQIVVELSSTEDALEEETGSAVPTLFGVTGRFVNRNGHPEIEEWFFDAGAYQLKIDHAELNSQVRCTVSTPSGSRSICPFSVPWRAHLSVLVSLVEILFSQETSNLHEMTASGEPLPKSELRVLTHLGYQLYQALGRRPFAFSPIRTRPMRTYDPQREAPHPEGTHVPMVLAQTYEFNRQRWMTLRDALVSFGKTSGLFCF